MKNYPNEKRIEHVKQWKESQLSCEEYCKQNNLHSNTLYRWRKVLKDKTDNKKQDFVKVNNKHMIFSETSSIIIENDEMKISVPVNIPAEQLSVILHTLTGR